MLSFYSGLGYKPKIDKNHETGDLKAILGFNVQKERSTGSGTSQRPVTQGSGPGEDL